MLVIRFARGGTNNRPFFHLVASERRGPRDGKYLERLGYYYPKEKDNTKKLKVDLVAVSKWMEKGAKPSETVAQLLKIAKENQNPK